MSQVLVTGANGHLGANTVRSLLNRGHQVVAFVRRDADLRGLEGLAVNLSYGDVTDYPSLTTAVQGCTHIIHHAAAHKFWASNELEISKPALVGTYNILRLARDTGIQRLVYTSSWVAVGSSYDPENLRTENDWSEDQRNPYFIIKTRCEREALDLAQTFDVPMIRICPTFALGPYDYRITPSMGIILNLASGRGTTWEGGINLVDVRDVAEAHAAALERGEIGGRYIVGGENIHFKGLGQLIARITGVTPRHDRTARRLALVIAGFFNPADQIEGMPPRLPKDLLHELHSRYAYYVTSLADHAFGIDPRGAEEILRSCIDWLVKIKALQPKNR
jgi:dihydroflavonol-4-reductase